MANPNLLACRTFLTSVHAVRDVHRHLRCITFAGGDLATFEPNGPDAFLYVLLPPPGRDELTIDAGFTWEQWAAMDEQDRPVGAYYTVRHWRPETTELDMLFVLHGDEGNVSPWATRAKPGDRVALWGPRTMWEPTEDPDWYLLVADDTGLPAVAGILEQLPEHATVRVIAEVDDPSTRQPLPEHPRCEVTWLYREGAPAGTTTLLLDAVRRLEWPAGTPYAWGAGESRTITAVRRHLRREVGLPRETVSMIPYWRHAAHEADPLDDDED